jgi:hypothetical protein
VAGVPGLRAGNQNSSLNACKMDKILNLGERHPLISVQDNQAFCVNKLVPVVVRIRKSCKYSYDNK